MFGFPHGSTRAALLVEHVDENGEKKILMYHMGMPLSVSVDYEYNVWGFRDGGTRIDPHSTRVTIEGYLQDPRVYDQGFPGDQPEIEPVNLAITQGDDEIVVDVDDFEDWQQE